MKRRFALASGVIMLAACLSPAAEETEQKASSWFDPGRLTLGARFGDVQEYVADALLPAWKPGRAILFLDLRGSALESKEQEGNFGLVARHLWPQSGLILGANVFYDVRATENDNTFGQIGGGVELLSKWIDLRANYYHPVTDEQALTDSVEVGTARNGRTTTTTTTLRRTYEEALPGYDAEAGVWLPWLDRFAPTGVFGGYYRFSSEYIPDISGPKVRIESRLHPNLTFDAEWYEDQKLNRTDYFVGVRVNLPFDFWNGLRFERSPGSNARPFESRMGDMVYRDFRIRTIVTGPVTVNRTVTESYVPATSAPPPTPPPTPTPPPVPPPTPPPIPNCYLDDNGDPVCH